MFGTNEARRAGVYRQLTALETAGIPLGTAVHKILDPAMAPVGRALDGGEDPGTAWARAGAFAPIEVALVRAGAKAGQLAESFQELEKIFEARAAARRKLLVGLAYPVFLMH